MSQEPAREPDAGKLACPVRGWGWGVIPQPTPHVWPYHTDVLRRLPAIAPNDTAALEALLPDRWLADHPEHRLEQREEESREAQARRRRKRAARRLAATQ